jgi:hypothetical protein
MTADAPRPLNVEVAEALGWTELRRTDFGLWVGRPSPLCVSLEQGGDRDVKTLRRFVPGNLSPDAPLVAVSDYPNDPAALWPLIVRYKIGTVWLNGRKEWVAGAPQTTRHFYHPTDPAIAVCELLVSLGKAGKLKP